MPDNLNDRLRVIERLTQVFRVERLVYVAITILSFVVLLVCAGVLVYNGEAGTTELSMLFGSSGLITYTGGRVLFMWSQALRAVIPETGNEAK